MPSQSVSSPFQKSKECLWGAVLFQTLETTQQTREKCPLTLGQRVFYLCFSSCIPKDSDSPVLLWHEKRCVLICHLTQKRCSREAFLALRFGFFLTMWDKGHPPKEWEMGFKALFCLVTTETRVWSLCPWWMPQPYSYKVDKCHLVWWIIIINRIAFNRRGC